MKRQESHGHQVDSAERSSFAAAARSPDWLIRLFGGSRVPPAWLGLGVAIVWPLLVGLVHTIADSTLGPAELPFGPSRLAWNAVVNGALLGLVLAGHAYLYLGALSDLDRLRPALPEEHADFARLAREVPNPPTSIRWLATLVGMGVGLALATLDPALRRFYSQVSYSDPRYVIYVVQNVLFGALFARLFAAEVHMTRAYARLGERVEVDLLDQSMLAVFARKGLRSVLVWVLISSIFSMFWVLQSAGQANAILGVTILVLATLALVAPTLGVHRNIASTKATELALVAEAIREERAAALVPRHADAPPDDPRLGNLIQYQKFVKSLREWPFDVSIVARSALLIVLGAGSWLGGAIVERLLALLLD